MGDTYPGLRMSAGELGCTYAALVLHADGAEITEDKIKTLLTAANVECESFWPGLFVKAFAGQDMDELITSPGGGGGGAAVMPVPLAVMPVLLPVTVMPLPRRRPPLRRTTCLPLVASSTTPTTIKSR